MYVSQAAVPTLFYPPYCTYELYCFCEARDFYSSKDHFKPTPFYYGMFLCSCSCYILLACTHIPTCYTHTNMLHTYQHVTHISTCYTHINMFTHIHIQKSCNREVGDLFSNCFETKKSQAEKDDGQESSHLLSNSAAKPSEPSTYRSILML